MVARVSPRDLVAQGRALAAELFIDDGRIHRPADVDQGVMDPVTGRIAVPVGSVIYEGPCRVRTPSLSEQSTLFGDEQVTTTRYVVSFPADIPPVQVGDTITVTSEFDAHASARSFRVVVVPTSTFLMARRFGVEANE